jgi:hypothetical protein
LLFGDERDEKQPEPLKQEIEVQGHDVTNAPEKKETEADQQAK